MSFYITIKLRRGETTIVTKRKKSGKIRKKIKNRFLTAQFHSLTALVNHSRELKTQALTKGRGCLHINIVSVESGLDNLALKWSAK
jgi:hypothetical protein